MTTQSSRWGSLATVLLVAVAVGCQAAPAAPTAQPSAAPPSAAPPSLTPTPVAPTAEPTAEAWTPEFVDGVLQPLPDGFPNRSITLLNPDESGARQGIWVRQVVEALRDKSPVALEILDRPDFGITYGSWEALGFVANEPGGNEGYMPIAISATGNTTDLISTPVAEELGVELEDMNFVIVMEAVPFFLTQRKDPPWGSTNVQDFIDYARANPGELKYICHGAGSGRDMTALYYFSKLEIEFDEPWVCSDGSEDTAAIIGAGLGDVALNDPPNTLIGFEAGRSDPIMVSGTVRAPAPFEDVPTAEEIIPSPNDPGGTRPGWAVTRETPDLHRQWLYELFRLALDDPEFQAQRAALPGITLMEADHDGAMEIAQAALDYFTPILEAEGLLYGGE